MTKAHATMRTRASSWCLVRSKSRRPLNRARVIRFAAFTPSFATSQRQPPDRAPAPPSFVCRLPRVEVARVGADRRAWLAFRLPSWHPFKAFPAQDCVSGLPSDRSPVARDDLSGFEGQPLQLGLDQLSQGLLRAVAVRAGIEGPGPWPDDRAGNRHHLAIEIALGAGRLERAEARRRCAT